MPAYMPKDKGRARRSLSRDKQTLRVASALADTGDSAAEGLSRSFREKSTMRNISPAKKKAYKDLSETMSKTAARERSVPPLKGK